MFSDGHLEFLSASAKRLLQHNRPLRDSCAATCAQPKGRLEKVSQNSDQMCLGGRAGRCGREALHELVAVADGAVLHITSVFFTEL